jgi:hypothetical protein
MKSSTRLQMKYRCRVKHSCVSTACMLNGKTAALYGDAIEAIDGSLVLETIA